MIDCHVHSDNSGDSTLRMADACLAAIDAGLAEICFTEHIDFEPTDQCYGTFDYDRFTFRIESARREFEGRLVIRAGAEVDYQVKYHPRIRDFLDGKAFDYVLGAAHYVDGTILEDHAAYFPGKTPEQAYLPYFDNTLALVETGWFDALAHLDLCKRYGVRYFGAFDWTPYAETIDRILRSVIDSNMSLEINTSGLRQSPGETYPGKKLLQRYYLLGGRNIIIGSDAHKVEHVGHDVAWALGIARDVGFEDVDTYENRRRRSRPIADLVKPQVALDE